MSTLKMHEKAIFEKLFDCGGYVLCTNFSDAKFAEFFREHGISINDKKYCFNGSSKMKRLRAFWEIEQDAVVGRALEALLKYGVAIGTEKITADDANKAIDIIARLIGKQAANKDNFQNEQAFLQQNFHKIDWIKLNIESDLQVVIQQRINEIGKALKVDAPLAVVFLCGSTLEGLLLDTAAKNITRFNLTNAAPKDKAGAIKPLQNWTLNDLINVAHEVGLLSLDVKKHSHALRDFRNYIHPRQQAMQKFNPDQHTARISWQVLQAAIADFSGQRR